MKAVADIGLKQRGEFARIPLLMKDAIVTRRWKRKMMKRAMESLLSGDFMRAERIYRELLSLFDSGFGNLTDHAACLYNLIQALDMQNKLEESRRLSDSAVQILSRHSSDEKAA